jgi:hypothetical protein
MTSIIVQTSDEFERRFAACQFHMSVIMKTLDAPAPSRRASVLKGIQANAPRMERE